MIKIIKEKIFGSDINKLNTYLFCLLIVTDLSIIFKLTIFREVLSVIFFSIVPGFLILSLLKLDKITFLKKLVLSFALSLSFLMFVGLGINFLYSINIMPFSLFPLLILLNCIILLLMLISLKRNKDLIFDQLFNYDINFKNKSFSFIIFPFLFPILAVIGTFLMNKMNYNIVILVMLLIIPFYLAFLLIFTNKVHKTTYPLTIWLISLALLLLHGLTSNHILGIDVFHEFAAFQFTLNNLHWDVVANANNAFYACTSITILPTIYTVISSMSGEYIFKLIYAFIGSFVPLAAYLTFKKYLKDDKAFLASLFIVFQNFFMLSMGASRQLVALLFFFLAIFVLFDSEISENSKKILFIISIWSVIISHYSTAYVALTILLPILLLPFLKNLIRKKITFKNFDIIILIFAFMLIWYSIFAWIQLTAGSGSINAVSASTTTSGFFSTNQKDASVLAIFGIGVKSIPNLISILANDLTFLIIFIGFLAISIKFKYYKNKIDLSFIVGICSFILLLILFIVLPLVSKLYGAPRLFLQSLIFLAPVFVFGSDEIAKLVRKPKISYAILFVLLIFLFSCSTYLQYHFYGIPYSPYYESNGYLHNEYFIYDQEVIAAKWLDNYDVKDLKIYTDAIGHQRLMLGGISFNNINPQFYLDNKTIEKGYIYQWNTNVNKRIVFNQLEKRKNISDFRNLFVGKYLIYDNGYARIWG